MSEPLHKRLEIPFVASLDGHAAVVEFVNSVPIGFARRHEILAVRDGDDILLACSDSSGLEQVQVVARMLGSASGRS